MIRSRDLNFRFEAIKAKYMSVSCDVRLAERTICDAVSQCYRRKKNGRTKCLLTVVEKKCKFFITMWGLIPYIIISAGCAKIGLPSAWNFMWLFFNLGWGNLVWMRPLLEENTLEHLLCDVCCVCVQKLIASWWLHASNERKPHCTGKTANNYDISFKTTAASSFWIVWYGWWRQAQGHC